MKALIVEKRGNYAAVLREDGIFEKIHNDGQVGERIILSNENKPIKQRRNKTGFIAAALLTCLIMTGSAFYMTIPASATVTLDTGEVAVEVEINRIGRVIGVDALNENSTEEANQLEAVLKGRKTENALEKAMLYLEENCVQNREGKSISTVVIARSEKQAGHIEESVSRATVAAEKRKAEGKDVPEFTSNGNISVIEETKVTEKASEGIPSQETGSTESEQTLNRQESVQERVPGEEQAAVNNAHTIHENMQKESFSDEETAGDNPAK